MPVKGYNSKSKSVTRGGTPTTGLLSRKQRRNGCLFCIDDDGEMGRRGLIPWASADLVRSILFHIPSLVKPRHKVLNLGLAFFYAILESTLRP